MLLRKIGSCSSSYHISKPGGCAGVFYGFNPQEAFVCDLATDQALCLLGSEDVLLWRGWMLTVGSLFSGIGGIELGLEATGGFRTIWQVEIDPYCRRILEKHWPEIPKYGDITRLDPASLERPDLLAGGFPCQDLSTAG
jgi:hypothetical protein